MFLKFLLFSFLSNTAVYSQCVKGYVQYPTSAKCVKVITAPKSFQDAIAWCMGEPKDFRNAALVSVHNQVQNQQLLELALGTVCTDSEIWIGLAHSHNKPGYEWIDGSPADFYNWAPGHVDEEGQDTQTFLKPSAGKWYSTGASDLRKCFVCEYDRDPPTTAVATTKTTTRTTTTHNAITTTAPYFCGTANLTAQDDSWRSWTSPNYLNDYYGSMYCTYMITAQTGHFVTFNVQYLEMEACCDFLQLYDGPSTASSQLIRLTGNTNDMPSAFRSQSNVVFAVFNKDSSSNFRGFRINFKSGASSCGATSLSAQDDSWKTWLSPNFPSNFLENRHCAYRITAPAGHFITFDILEFELERNNDSLTFYDGPSMSSSVLWRLTGNMSYVPSGFVSQLDVVLAVFTTDYSNNLGGFRINYKSGASSCGTTSLFAQDYTWKAWSSPNYPSNYLANSHCAYTIIAPAGHFIAFNILEFELERNYDYLTFYDGPSMSSSVLLRLTGNMSEVPSEFVSQLDVVLAVFTADYSNNLRGFRIDYMSGASSCGATSLSAQDDSWKTWSSPNYPSSYLANTHCAYTITAPAGHFIKFEILGFELERNYDYLTFHDGPSMSGSVLWRLTGSMSDVPSEFESQLDVVLAVFTTDDSKNLKGFRIDYMSGASSCSATSLSAQDDTWKTWSSPNYPSNYLANTHCGYTITAPAGHFIKFEILGFELESSWDYLTFHDGPSMSSSVLWRLTGNMSDVPSEFASQSDVVLAVFATDGSNNLKGFRIDYMSGQTWSTTTTTTTTRIWTTGDAPATGPGVSAIVTIVTVLVYRLI